jgi:glycosyltransferase involved in cell wall biosynthesis
MYLPSDITLYVPCFNSSATISLCVDALCRQTIQPFEIFVINDGSIEPLPKLPVRIITHEKNQGLASARNTALANCQTKLIASVDADVLADLDWLECLLQVFNSQNVVGVGGRLEEFYKSDIGDRWRAKHMAQHWGDNSLINPRFLFGANTLFLVETIKDCGGYDIRCRTNNEDRTLCENIYDRKLRLAYVPSAKCQHLRRDTVYSILSSYWGWHHMKGIVDGDFKSISGLMSRIDKVNFGISVYRYELDKASGSEDFAILDSLIPLVFCAKDLQLYSRLMNEAVPSLSQLITRFGLERYTKDLEKFLPVLEKTEIQEWHESYLLKIEENLKTLCTRKLTDHFEEWLRRMIISDFAGVAT